MDNWIKVVDGTPTDSISKLVWCPGRRNKYTACFVNGEWVHFGPYGHKVVEEAVTHWMETPTPPYDPTKQEIIEDSIISTIQKINKFPEWGESLRPFAKTIAEEILNDLGENG